MLCMCRRAHPGERSPWLDCQDGMAEGGPQGERRGLGSLVYFLLIFVVICNVEAYWNRIK